MCVVVCWRYDVCSGIMCVVVCWRYHVCSGVLPRVACCMTRCHVSGGLW